VTYFVAELPDFFFVILVSSREASIHRFNRDEARHWLCAIRYVSQAAFWLPSLPIIHRVHLDGARLAQDGRLMTERIEILQTAIADIRKEKK
jgi:hypothetical protein